MAFTHALYYPWIDIEDTAWLKTAILYWDKISTIVPMYYHDHYQNPDMAFLQTANVLIPEFVYSGHDAVHEASENFSRYLTTSEASGILLPPGSKNYQIPALEQTNELARLNEGKIDGNLRDELLQSGRVLRDGEWLIFDRDSINYYMTLLASSISRQKNYAMLTDTEKFEPLSNKVRRGDRPTLRKREIGEGLLARMTLESIGIAPETPFEDILRFKTDYKDELGWFRTKIGKVAQEIDPETPTTEALQQQVHDIFTNKIAPAINTLRDTLSRARIRNFVTQLTSAIFMASVPFLPKDSPASLMVGATCQIAAQGVTYALNRSDQLSQNPYSFVLKVEEQLA